MGNKEWNLSDLSSSLEKDFVLGVSHKEARLIDWIFTCHTWEIDLYDRLSSPTKENLRERIGVAFISNQAEREEEFILQINEEELKELLVLIPGSWQLGSEDVGYSLKQKLYKLLLGVYNLEISEKGGQNVTDKDSSKAEDNPESIA